jgi:hypothetical protein
MTRTRLGRPAAWWTAAGALAIVALAGAAALLWTTVGSHRHGTTPRIAWVSPAGADTGTCSKQAPCATLTRAVSYARAGGEVLLTSGNYPAQEIHGRAGSGERPVVVRPAPGARVTTGRIALHVTGLELRGLTMRGWYAYQDSGHLTFRDDHVRWFFVDSASNIRILGGSVGPSDAIDPQIRAVDRNGSPVPRNILIDGVRFHDFTKATDPAAHVECLQFGAGSHVVVRRSSFYNCADTSIFVGAWGGTATVHDFTFEDNHFANVPVGYYSLRVAADDPKITSKILVRNNTATTTMRVDPAASGVVWEDNLAPRYAWECFPSQRYVANVWVGPKAATCSSTDRLDANLDVALKAARDPRSRPGTAGLTPRTPSILSARRPPPWRVGPGSRGAANGSHGPGSHAHARP